MDNIVKTQSWLSKDRCPRCGEAMIHEESEGIWDMKKVSMIEDACKNQSCLFKESTVNRASLFVLDKILKESLHVETTIEQ